MKRFKSYKKNKLKSKVIFMIFLLLYIISYKCINDNKLKNSILKKDINYFRLNIIKEVNKAFNDNVLNPANLLSIKVKKETKKSNVEVQKVMATQKYEPIIYLYNTHQSEQYDGYSVYEATKYLNDELKDESYFEMNSVSAFLSENNMKYSKSYIVSRKYLNEARKMYPSLTYFIDIHRDSVSKDRVTLKYKGKNYAKVLFIVGLDNKNYNSNLKNTNKMSDLIDTLVPGISRGIMKKGGKGVNGVYNQDLSDNVFLFEVGSSYSTKEEVKNTIDVIKKAIILYMGGNV